MKRVIHKSFDRPDETISLPGVTEELVEVGELTVGRVVTEPGWRWSTHVRPLVGGESCQAHHAGVVVSGRFSVELEDGRSFELAPGDVYEIPPGHDGFTVGDEPAVVIEWSGMRAFAGPHAGMQARALMTLLFTDLVESTSTAARLGDVAWRELLTRHYQASRRELERFRGREVSTTGDGILAVFEGPVAAASCAAAIRAAAQVHGLQIRAGIHVGEVEVAGEDVRGLAVHEAARIMAAAEAGQILVSEITRTLAMPSGLGFQDRGTHLLKGLEGERRLYSYEPG